MMTPRIFFIAGSVSAFLAVALGAFAAHTLKQKLDSELFSVFEVGVRYHFYHALALFVVSWSILQFPSANVTPAGLFFIAGTILFSGSLYVLSITGLRWLGMITPLGGLCFLAGWAWLAWTAWKS